MTKFAEELSTRVQGAIANQGKIDEIIGRLGAPRAELVAPDPATIQALSNGAFEVVTGVDAIECARKLGKRISGSRITIEISYDEIVKKLGAPDDSPSDGKSAADWFIKLGDDYFAIYDQRLRADVNCDGTGLSVDEIRSSLRLPWSIGGTEKGAKLSAFVAYLQT